MSSIVYRINDLGDLADHFASMMPHVQRAIDATSVQREQHLLRRELVTLQMVVNTIRNTVLEPAKEKTNAV